MSGPPDIHETPEIDMVFVEKPEKTEGLAAYRSNFFALNIDDIK
ncbi:conserved hypothetical protein [delta proteobacterium NaphS2]|nr:conserved hypothetical protein [delta proteobacterium NaphS2]